VDVSEDGLLVLNTFDQIQEEEANWLAGCLLLPRDALMLIRRHGMDLKVAAKRYGVSFDMLRYRTGITGVNYQFGVVRRLRGSGESSR
jgi:Zn-dependent peptidase ImmA (M78 family)